MSCFQCASVTNNVSVNILVHDFTFQFSMYLGVELLVMKFNIFLGILSIVWVFSLCQVSAFLAYFITTFFKNGIVLEGVGVEGLSKKE